MDKQILQNKQGMSLIEVLVSIFIIGILISGIYALVILSLRITADNTSYVEAIEIANQKMEQIRNLPYTDVGTAGGTPNGVIPEYETINREGYYTVHTTIVFYDDPYDGTIASSTDSIFIDYKIATVEVSWGGSFKTENVTIFSKVIPNTEETDEGYGLLKISVVDSSGSPVPNANIHVENNILSPIVNADYTADSNGEYALAALPAFESYEITVTKTGYSTDKTYARDAVNLNPTRPHLSVFDAEKTEESFAIDTSSSFQIRTVSNTLPNNWQVNETASTSNKTNIRASLDSADNMYFVWQAADATSSYVYTQKYNQSAVKQWASDQKIADTAFQANPDIITSASGNSFIVWQDNSALLKLTAKINPTNSLASNKVGGENIKVAYDYIPTTNLNAKYGDISFITINDPVYNFVSPNKIKNYKEYSSAVINYFQGIFKPSEARAAGSASIVQTKTSSIGDHVYNMTATFDNAPTEGNVIIAMAMHRNDYASFSAPTNSAGTFTESVYSNSSWYLDVGIWHKVAGASEPSQVTITSDNHMHGGVLMLMEVSGLDINNLIDVTTVNDQTSSNSRTATTGSTAASGQNGFAVAAIGWGDNDFNTPNSSNWSSGSSDNWTHRLWEDWWLWWSNDGSLAVATLDVTAAAAQSATLTVSGGGSSEQRNSALAVFRISSPDNVTASAIGSQTSSTTIPTNDLYVGGTFVITDNTGSRNVTDITITEYGTVDAQNDLDNVKLFYDQDTVFPHDCADETYDAGSDDQFGSNTNFNGADGTASFNSGAGVPIDTSKALCVYVILDVTTGASKNETLEIKINNPSTDVVISSGAVIPDTAVEISGTTNLLKPMEFQQIHYRWLNDDGGETGATWKENEDTASSIAIGTAIRARFEISNVGSYDSGNIEYRIEYGEKSTACSDISAWTAIPTDNTQHWQITDSSYFTDGDSTTNVSGSLTDENTSFKAGTLKDTSNQTAGITVTSSEFTEIEYAIKATNNATGSDYCFRLTNAGSTANFTFIEYPKISIVGDNNIYIKSLDSNGNVLWTTKKVNSDSTDEEQINPRIAFTENFGAATTTIVWEDNRSANSDIYAQSFDTAGNKLWTNDLIVTGSTTREHSPVVAIDSNDNILVAWVSDNAAGKDIYLQKYDLAGNNLWSDAKILASSTNDEYSPNLTVDGSNNIYLTWTEDGVGAKNAKLAKYDTDAVNLWQKAANLEDSSDDQYTSEIAVNSSYIYVSWTDTREENRDIYTQKYDLNGNASWSEDLRININLGTSTQENSDLIINSADEPFGAWEDDRDGEFNIYATKFNDPGTPIGVSGVPIIVTGTKQIGDNPVIYKYNEEYTTDGSGYTNLTIEWDVPGYSVELKTASTSLNIILRSPIQPMDILAGESKTMYIYVE